MKFFEDKLIFVDLISQGIQLFKSKKFNEAATRFRRALGYCGSKDFVKEIIVHEGMCYLYLEDYDKATELFDESLKIESEFGTSKDKTASLNDKLNATDIFQEANEIFSDFSHRSDILLFMGKYLKNLENYSKALETFYKALCMGIEFEEKAKNLKSSILWIQGLILSDEEKHSKAAEKFRDAIKLRTVADTREAHSEYLERSFSSIDRSRSFEAIESRDKVYDFACNLEIVENFKDETLEEDSRN